MRNSVISKVLGLGLVLAFSSAAFATDNGYQGALCNPQNPTAAANLNYSMFGVNNVSTTATAGVQCGGAPVVGGNVNLIQATVYDRSSTQDVCCFLDVQNADGGIQASSFQCTSGFASASMLLSFSPPANAGQTAEIECTIPAQTANGFSHVTSYRIRS